MRAEDITPGIKCKNEEYWIGYVLRDLFTVFGRVMMVDTGSTDDTKLIAKDVAQSANGDLWLFEHDFGDDACKIGNAPNMLMDACPTPWMMLVDADEIWLEPQLRSVLEWQPAPGIEVGMVVGRNLRPTDEGITMADGMSSDRLFDKDKVRWHKTDYPFESHGLHDRLAQGAVDYLDGNVAWYWHVRHLDRSPLDSEAYFREDKIGYFPYCGPQENIPDDWFGELGPWPNPYLGVG